MSLKTESFRFALESPLFEFGERLKGASRLDWEKQITVGAVGMWKSRRLRFPRAVDDGGKLDVELGLPVTRDESFPPASTARHFHSALLLFSTHSLYAAAI
jgi:hypothetical protein